MIQQVYFRFGFNVMATRRAKRMSQAVLAKKLGISRGSLANVETGRQRILLHSVPEYAAALGCSIKQLTRGIYERL